MNKEELEEYIKYWQNEYDKKVEIIDKAIEYIKENNSVFGTNLDMNYLLEILKGE